MPMKKYIKSMRSNVARSVTRWARRENKTYDQIAREATEYLTEKNSAESITKADITRINNTTGGPNGEGAPISWQKMAALEKFLKSRLAWEAFEYPKLDDLDYYFSFMSHLMGKKYLSNNAGIFETFREYRQRLEPKEHPLSGEYRVIRHSMHALGNLSLSKIKFFSDPSEKSIIKFNETRFISKEHQEYTCRVEGFVNFVRGTYILHGVSFSTDEAASYTPFPEISYFHDDSNPRRLLGIWTSSTRENKHPMSTPVVMRHISKETYENMNPDSDKPKLRLGIIDPEKEAKVVDGTDIRVLRNSTKSYEGIVYIDGKTPE